MVLLEAICIALKTLSQFDRTVATAVSSSAQILANSIHGPFR